MRVAQSQPAMTAQPAQLGLNPRVRPELSVLYLTIAARHLTWRRPYRRLGERSPWSFPSHSVTPSIDVARCRPPTRCGVTDLENAVGRAPMDAANERPGPGGWIPSDLARALCGCVSESRAAGHAGYRVPWKPGARHRAFAAVT